MMMATRPQSTSAKLSLHPYTMKRSYILLAFASLPLISSGYGWSSHPPSVSSSSFRISSTSRNHPQRIVTPYASRLTRPRIYTQKDSYENSSSQESSELQQSGQRRRSSIEDNDDNTTQANKNVTAVVEKKIRLAHAQAEIDRILLGPDPPLDLDHEMKKVIHIAPPPQHQHQQSSNTMSVIEQELEEKESKLELELYQAVKREEFAKAASLKRDLNQMHMDDCGAVLQANSMFYRAFSDKNLKEMEALWFKDATATCIHPSTKPLLGYKQVCDSWKRMFDASGSFQRTWMEPHNIRISVKGATMAIISCDEHVYVRQFVRGQKRQTELINKLTATNIFRKLDGRWYMMHHHASWHPDSEITKVALRQRQSSVVLNKSLKARKESAEPSIGMDGILGMTNNGPLLGSSSSGQQQQKPVKRIVMGNLNDIINGQLGDLLGGSGNGGDSDSDMGRAILSFSRIDDSDDEDEDDDDDDVDLVELVDDDDDDDDEDNDEDDDEASSAPQAVSIIKEWARSSSNKKKGSSNKSKINNVSGAPKDALRQNCIMALRRLCDQGSISQKQKRLLLTDIISCSAKGEFSLVEVAFELLCGEAGGDMDLAEEEFADQCRVLALTLSSPDEHRPSD